LQSPAELHVFVERRTNINLIQKFFQSLQSSSNHSMLLCDASWKSSLHVSGRLIPILRVNRIRPDFECLAMHDGDGNVVVDDDDDDAVLCFSDVLFSP